MNRGNGLSPCCGTEPTLRRYGTAVAYTCRRCASKGTPEPVDRNALRHSEQMAGMNWQYNDRDVCAVQRARLTSPIPSQSR